MRPGGTHKTSTIMNKLLDTLIVITSIDNKSMNTFPDDLTIASAKFYSMPNDTAVILI